MDSITARLLQIRALGCYSPFVLPTEHVAMNLDSSLAKPQQTNVSLQHTPNVNPSSLKGIKHFSFRSSYWNYWKYEVSVNRRPDGVLLSELRESVCLFLDSVMGAHIGMN